MLPYFPLHEDTFKMTMGVQALDSAGRIEVDEEQYQHEITLKNELLGYEYEQYFQAMPDTEAMQWEVIALLLPDMLAHYPQYFSLSIDGNCWTWGNQLLNTETTFVFGRSDSLPLLPLDWLGRQMQEDLLLLDGDREAGMPLVAGQLCFPNDWCLADKMGQSFLNVHKNVPLFAEHLGRSSNLLLERLKVARPVWRVNWSIKATSRLNLTPQFFHEQQQASQDITPDTIGQRCLLRIERQTLSRLPMTNAILFTIHTYQEPLEQVVSSIEYARRLLGVVRSMPAQLLLYKGMAPFEEMLLSYLAERAQQP